jgi:hypothetical protein
MAGAVIAPVPGATVVRMLAALEEQHRRELAQARALQVRYREFIEKHGLRPPDDTGAEALRRYRAAFEAAGVEDPLQHPELVQDWAA